jgi:adenylate kinase family enzyme
MNLSVSGEVFVIVEGMSLIFIGGTAGTGKSTVCRALKARGYDAYDVDSDGLAGWQNLQTGYMHPKSSIKSADRTPEFLQEHGWHVPINKVEELCHKSKGRLVFLVGDIRNEDELYDLFDGFLALYVDDDTLIHRLATRTDNDWGKQPHELKRSLERHHKIYDTYRVHGAVVIDATKPVEQVASDVIAATSHLSHP